MIEYLDTEIKNQVLQVIKNQKGSQSETKSHVTSIIRLFDILISVSALIVTFPVVFVISIILFFLNGKPIIFKQIRLGKNGEKFHILKFRTMRSDATDILKEDQAQNTCIFSTEFALRLMGDVQEYFIENNVRNFYSVSISGYGRLIKLRLQNNFFLELFITINIIYKIT
mgnify:CR=1 FL=1